MSKHEPVTITLNDFDPELQAISHMSCILERFSLEARHRMLNYLCERFPDVIIATTPERVAISERGR